MTNIEDTPPEPTPLLSDRLYDVLKQLVQLVIPAIGALYFGLAQIWGFPNAEEVVGTCALIATFLGVFLQFSKRSYEASPTKYDGAVVISQNAETGAKLYSLELNVDPSQLDGKKDVTFKVEPGTFQ